MTVAAAPIAAGRAGPDHLPMLDQNQVGHIRHIRNLVRQPPGSWALMQGDDPDNSRSLTSYRWQLMAMGMLLAIAHRIHLPAASGFFKADFAALCERMLRREVWAFWRGMSRSSRELDPDLDGPRTGWWDPVVKENIHYSGLLLQQLALFGYLFNDSKYESSGSIRFEPGVIDLWADPVEYDLQTLADIIYWQMVESGYLGVACQPNNIFIGCNAYALQGFRFLDARRKTGIADELIGGFRKAWERRGAFIPERQSPFGMRIRQDTNLPDPWAATHFHVAGLYPDYFQSVFPELRASTVCEIRPGEYSVYPPTQQPFVSAAYHMGQPLPPLDRSPTPFEAAMGMWPSAVAVQCAEAGDLGTRDALVRVADVHCNPTWRDGGLFYPRCDRIWNDDGHAVAMLPIQGNAQYGLARLRTKGAMATLVNDLWPASHFTDPQLAALSEDLDVYRAVYVPEVRLLTMHFRPKQGLRQTEARVVIGNAARAGNDWTLFIDGENVANGGSAGIRYDTRVNVTMQGDALVICADVTNGIDVMLQWGQQ